MAQAIENWGFSPAAKSNNTGASAPVVASSGIDQYLQKIGFKGTPDEFYAKYGVAPEGGWSDANTYQTPYYSNRLTGKSLSTDERNALFDKSTQVEGGWIDTNGDGDPDFRPAEDIRAEYGPANIDLQGWLKDPSQLKGLNLYGDGSPEAIQRGFNILQYMAPRNIGEFGGLSPEVQKVILQNPEMALQRMAKMANPANGDWLSVGAEGGFTDLGAYQTDGKNLGADPSKYMQINGEDWVAPVQAIGTVLQFTPLAPLGYAMNTIAAAESGNPAGAFMSAIGGAGSLGAFGAGGLGGQLGSSITGAAATDLSSKLVGNGLLGAAQGATTGNAGKGALIGAIGTGISDAVGSANQVAKDDVTGNLINGATSSALKTAASGLINSQFGNSGNSGNSNATQSVGGGSVATPLATQTIKPVKIERWGY